jgi:hypothetical protein
MSKKKCCCDKEVLGSWCDHEHYSIDWYETTLQNGGKNPAYFLSQGSLQQCKQPNWRALGTLTTELPSIGHPMTSLRTVSSTNCTRVPNPDSGLYEELNPQTGLDEFFSDFRTSSTNLNSKSYVWGPGPFYGDITPCWFNGINMTNIENEEESFFELTFKLKIEKLVGSSWNTVIDTKINGPARNIRPHPDTVRSYNVSVDHLMWAFQSGCDTFFEQVDPNTGDPLPCDQDFARMPRGPWPYRFKRFFDINRDDVEHCYNPIDGSPYTVKQVRDAKANPSSVIGTPFENILQCEVSESDCTNLDSGCCNKDFLSKKELCDQLDEEGTPYGWEDCPQICQAYSNHTVLEDSNKLKFFGWIEPSNRYTTPEWDVEDILTEENKKLSLHVIVPTQFKEIISGGVKTGFCYADGQPGKSFGEWSFGMDCEANQGEIEALEAAGFPWSNGREKDGLWLHKTPTNALRMLFTLDHADLDQGKVWRVFKDWNVKVTNYVKTFNLGTPNEVKFRFNIEQKVEEKFLSSIGCDCPSGYFQNDGGTFSRVRPSACDDQIPGFENNDPITCGGNCASPYLHCMNNLKGTKLSFAERGPIILKVDIETSGVGCQICGDPDDPNTPCEHFTGGTTKIPNGEEANEGIKLVINSGTRADVLPFETVVEPLNSLIYSDLGPWPSAGNFSCPSNYTEISGSFPAVYVDPNGAPIPIPGIVYDIYREHAPRYCGALADLPFPAGHVGSPNAGKRYRNNYVSIQQARSASLNEETNLVPFGFYPHIYGDSYCNWSGPCDPPIGTPYNVFQILDWPAFNLKPEDYPSKGLIGYCKIDCECKLPGEGCQNCGNSNSGGGGGPNLCPCCINALPDFSNCREITQDEINRGCPFITVNGLNIVPPCTGGPVNPSCRCDCAPGCKPTNADPGPDPTDKRHPFYRCGPILLYPQGRQLDDALYTCSPKWADGDILPCFYPIPESDWWLGMDSERIYFRTEGTVPARSGLGDPQCYPHTLIPGCCENSLNCSFNYCDPSNCYSVTKKCKFCRGEANLLGIGLGEMFFNWRKYLCQRRTKDNYLPKTNEVELLDINCTASKSTCNNGSVILTDDANACNHLWKFSYDEITNFSDLMCGINGARDRDLSLRLKLSKYEIPSDKYEDGWLPWETKYQPNPGRNTDRSHIVITAKGLD